MSWTYRCPFCGCYRITAVVVEVEVRVRCEYCWAMGPPSPMTATSDDHRKCAKADAVRLWRERAAQ